MADRDRARAPSASSSCATVLAPTDAELGEHGEYLRLGAAAGERVLNLEIDDGMNTVGAAGGLDADLGEADVARVARLHEVRDGPRHEQLVVPHPVEVSRVEQGDAAVARELTALRPSLRTAALPLALGSAPMELLWRSSVEDDEAIRFMRGLGVRVAKTVEGAGKPGGREPASVRACGEAPPPEDGSRVNAEAEPPPWRPMEAGNSRSHPEDPEWRKGSCEGCGRRRRSSRWWRC